MFSDDTILKKIFSRRKEVKQDGKEGKIVSIGENLVKKHIDWLFFFQNYIKARDINLLMRHQKERIIDKISKDHKNIKLMDNDQFDLWQGCYFETFDEINTQGVEIAIEQLRYIFGHKFMPPEYHYEPLVEYSKDNYSKLRCCWMM
jgi:hypothetical protein